MAQSDVYDRIYHMCERMLVDIKDYKTQDKFEQLPITVAMVLSSIMGICTGALESEKNKKENIE